MARRAVRTRGPRVPTIENDTLPNPDESISDFRFSIFDFEAKTCRHRLWFFEGPPANLDERLNFTTLLPA
jgi:hypothetical protein